MHGQDVRLKNILTCDVWQQCQARENEPYPFTSYATTFHLISDNSSTQPHNNSQVVTLLKSTSTSKNQSFFMVKCRIYGDICIFYILTILHR